MLISCKETPKAVKPADNLPEYTADDASKAVKGDPQFAALVTEVQAVLGVVLNSNGLKELLGFYDYLGLPTDVIYLLVCHCADRVAKKYGPGRRPGMKQIEKEGYTWARLGIDSQLEAAEYLKKYAQRQGMLPELMRVLQLGDRLPSASEEKYLTAWQEMGFEPEAVALAYDKTVLKCHELKRSEM